MTVDRPAGGAPHPRLLADVGGTHARLAWAAAAGAPLSRIATFDCDAHAGLDDVVVRYLAAERLPSPRAVAIGIATAVVGDEVAMTNRPSWRFSVAELRRRWGVERLLVLNDFAALARGLPSVDPAELRSVGGGSAREGEPIAVLGPGSGLGVAGLVASPAGFVPVVGEGGHATLAAVDRDEERILGVVRDEFGHASAERVLSGPGLVHLHRAIRSLAGAPRVELAASEISERAVAGDDAACVETVERFFAFLGGFAGNLALTLGARGGVFIAGGIVPRLVERIDASAFRRRFEDKGRFRPYLEAIATRVVLQPAMLALRGADAALDAAPGPGSHLVVAR